MGVDTRMVRDKLRMIGAITARNSGGYLAAPKWSDLLFDTLGPVQKNGYRYPTGVVRIRPGKQDEFLNRVREAYAFRFGDRKSTRLNSSHVKISYAVFCLKKK